METSTTCPPAGLIDPSFCALIISTAESTFDADEQIENSCRLYLERVKKRLDAGDQEENEVSDQVSLFSMFQNQEDFVVIEKSASYDSNFPDGDNSARDEDSDFSDDEEDNDSLLLLRQTSSDETYDDDSLLHNIESQDDLVVGEKNSVGSSSDYSSITESDEEYELSRTKSSIKLYMRVPGDDPMSVELD